MKKRWLVPRKPTFTIPVPKMDAELLGLVAQAKQIHKEFGKAGLDRFLRESEKMNDLEEGALQHLSDIILGVKRS